MSEYRRFVAYFYEYTDGKKQQNAGFAKVELRDGMWRILFRLTISETPEPPLQVYGFVREKEVLQGFLLGTMNSRGTAPEEWAWRADTPLGMGKYYFGEMNGIRIESSDGRSFFTVWDDEAMNPSRFVLERPQPEEPEPPAHPEEKPEEPKPPVRPEKEPEEPKPPAQPEEKPVQPTRPEMPSPGAVEMPAPQITEMPQRESPRISEPGVPEMPVQESPMISEPDVPEMPLQPPTEMSAQQLIEMPAAINMKMPSVRPRKERNPAESLLRSRQGFRPFQDEEFTDCVQIKLCDVLPLQQENWRIGRSNFLQHGYYLYRHLLLGRTKDGGYILGVPGMRNQQEEYMAQMFGYDHFKQSGSNGSGRRFGYWYRILKEPERADGGMGNG